MEISFVKENSFKNNLKAIVEQLHKCKYVDELGHPLENNVAFIELQELSTKSLCVLPEEVEVEKGVVLPQEDFYSLITAISKEEYTSIDAIQSVDNPTFMCEFDDTRGMQVTCATNEFADKNLQYLLVPTIDGKFGLIDFEGNSEFTHLYPVENTEIRPNMLYRNFKNGRQYYVMFNLADSNGNCYTFYRRDGSIYFRDTAEFNEIIPIERIDEFGFNTSRRFEVVY